MSKKSELVKKWRRRTKARIIEAMGGKCQCCGYNKCHNSLDLHHINPEEKELAFGGIRASPKRWELIVKELRKCILVCRNCHGEIHAGIRMLPDEYTSFNEEYADYKGKFTHLEQNGKQLITRIVKVKSFCPVCGKEKSKNNKTCSIECHAFTRRKCKRPSKQELQTLLNKSSFVQIGKQFGVSDNAVRKWCKRYELI